MNKKIKKEQKKLILLKQRLSLLFICSPKVMKKLPVN